MRQKDRKKAEKPKTNQNKAFIQHWGSRSGGKVKAQISKTNQNKNQYITLEICPLQGQSHSLNKLWQRTKSKVGGANLRSILCHSKWIQGPSWWWMSSCLPSHYPPCQEWCQQTRYPAHQRLWLILQERDVQGSGSKVQLYSASLTDGMNKISLSDKVLSVVWSVFLASFRKTEHAGCLSLLFLIALLTPWWIDRTFVSSSLPLHFLIKVIVNVMDAWVKPWTREVGKLEQVK